MIHDIFDLYMAAALTGICSHPGRYGLRDDEVCSPQHAATIAIQARTVAEAALIERARHWQEASDREAQDR